MAYGARLESVLGASPRGFESPILRHRTPGPLQVPGFLLPMASRVVACGAAGVPGAVGPGRLDWPGRCVCRWAVARPRAVRAASSARRVVSKPGQALPPPTAAAARPSGALRTGGACGAVRIGRQSDGPALLNPGLVPLRLRGPRRSLRPGARPGPRPSQRASIGAGPSRCSSIRPRTPSRSGAAMSRVCPPA